MIDARPFDHEPEQLRAVEAIGTYRVNGRAYLECAFPDLELTGLPCEQAPDLLAFHAFPSAGGVVQPRLRSRRRGD